MTNIILALFFHAPGTDVTIINPVKYEKCPATVLEYTEYKDVVYYSVQIKSPCERAKLHNLLETDFTVLDKD